MQSWLKVVKWVKNLLPKGPDVRISDLLVILVVDGNPLPPALI